MGVSPSVKHPVKADNMCEVVVGGTTYVTEDSADARVKALENEHETQLQKVQVKHENAVACLEQQLADLQENIERKAALINDLERELDAKKEEIEQLEEDGGTKDARINELEVALSDSIADFEKILNY